jgi:hypothetical protein
VSADVGCCRHVCRNLSWPGHPAWRPKGDAALFDGPLLTSGMPGPRSKGGGLGFAADECLASFALAIVVRPAPAPARLRKSARGMSGNFRKVGRRAVAGGKPGRVCDCDFS